jgi:hypothetical protein
VSPVRYELGLYIPEDDNLHSHRRENLKSYNMNGAHLASTTRITNESTYFHLKEETQSKIPKCHFLLRDSTMDNVRTAIVKHCVFSPPCLLILIEESPSIAFSLKVVLLYFKTNIPHFLQRFTFNIYSLMAI